MWKGKSRLLSYAVLLVAGAAIALIVSHTAASPSGALWTEGPAPAPATTPWVNVAKTDTAAVVNISTRQVVKTPNPLQGVPPEMRDFFKQFFGTQPPSRVAESLGSGFIVRADGYIVTNNHVVDGATEIKVKLADGRTFPAQVIGRDKQTDLALLKIDASNLPVLPFGNSDALQVGQPVAAIGNPFGLQGTVTTGIVSAKGRVIGEGPYDNFIQTDASINPGNSGGPLVNSSGEVIGINTAIFSQSGGSMGIGFAIPVNLAKSILPQLQAQGHVTRGWLGVSIQPVTPELATALQLPKDQGALVGQVLPHSPAQKAGVQPGDVIVQYAGHAIERASDLPLLVAETPIGQPAALQILRNGKSLTLTAQIAALPAQQPVAAAPSREQLGLTVQPLTPQLAQAAGVQGVTTGLVVTDVQDGSAAADAGIQPGDVITQVNRKPVTSVADLRQALQGEKAGAATLFQIHRKDATLFVGIEMPRAPQG